MDKASDLYLADRGRPEESCQCPPVLYDTIVAIRHPARRSRCKFHRFVADTLVRPLEPIRGTYSWNLFLEKEDGRQASGGMAADSGGSPCKTMGRWGNVSAGDGGPAMGREPGDLLQGTLGLLIL